MQIGVIGELEQPNAEELTYSTTWAAAIEEELFKATNYRTLYTDLLVRNERLMRAEQLIKVHNMERFSKLQTEFLVVNNPTD